MKKIITPGTSEIIIKKSRFLGTVLSVSSEEEARAYLAAEKKTHYAARHTCHAFRFGDAPATVRFSDDGEPGGTAGKPILSVIEGSDVRDILIMVTRYFGGTLLGTGGLVRAYTEAAQAALENAELREIRLRTGLTLRLTYSDLDTVTHILQKENYPVEADYTDTITIRTMVPSEEVEPLTTLLTEKTAGRATFTAGEAQLC